MNAEQGEVCAEALRDEPGEPVVAASRSHDEAASADESAGAPQSPRSNQTPKDTLIRFARKDSAEDAPVSEARDTAYGPSGDCSHEDTELPRVG